MDCEREGNYKKKNSFKGTFGMKVKCPFMMRYVSSDIGLKVMVRCGFHNRKLAIDLDGHDILGRLKYYES